VKVSIKLGGSETENLVQVVILVLLSKLFLDLGKDFTALSVSHSGNALHDFANEASQGCVVTLPLHLDIVAHELNTEFELSAFGKVCKLSQVLLEHALPDLSKDASLRGCTEAEIGGVDLERDNCLWLLKLVVLEVPQVCHSIELLNELWARR